MKNSDAWEREYQNSSLITLSFEPQVCVKDFIRWLRKETTCELEHAHVLDIGCGNGKNSLYIHSHGAQYIEAFDIAPTAILYAEQERHRQGIPESALKLSVQSCVPNPRLPYSENNFDIALDITTTNSLTSLERQTFLKELFRIMKPEGYILLRTLKKDGDIHAKNLLKMYPGPETDMYILPGTHHAERVFSRVDLEKTYTDAGFKFIHLDTETHYTKMGDRRYKRNFWVAYLQKPR